MSQDLLFIAAKQRHAELVELIKNYDKEYYTNDNAVIDDASYDKLRQELEHLEEQHSELAIDSPSQKVGYLVQNEFQKHEHSQAMLSLANAFSEEDIEDFISRVKKFLNITTDLEFLAEPKIDGISFAAHYQNGELILGLTRGDGQVGEVITENLKVIKSLPNKLTGNYPEKLEVRGEIYMSKANFAALNQEQEKQGSKIFANPRNAASGSLRQLDTAITAERNLDLFIYAVHAENFANTQLASLEKIAKLGFPVNSLNRICHTSQEIMANYQQLSDERYKLDYDIDGIVYKVNDYSLQERLGFVARSPRFAIAHKFPAEIAKTKLEDIIIQVGRTGALTPVAVLTPVNIGGVVVERASLHNEDEIKRKDIKIGDIVLVKRAGDVIPQIDSVDSKKRTAAVKDFIFPNSCPVCSSALEKPEGEAVTRCTGGNICKAQLLGGLKHFVSKNAFDIDGLRDKQVEFLYEKGLVTNFSDFFTLAERQHASLTKLENYPGWGKKSVTKLYAALAEKQIISLERFIYALGIRYIGQNTAKLLSKNYLSIENFLQNISQLSENSETYQALVNIDGIGTKVADKLLEFFGNNDNYEQIKQLAELLKIEDFAQNISNSIFANKVIVFTGSLTKMTRHEAKAKAETLGAKVTGSVSKNTDYVICGEAAGSKKKKAEELQVKILSEDEWLSLI